MSWQRFFLPLIKPIHWPSHFYLPKYQTHRGYWLEGQRENTMGSIREAQSRGANCVEVDVRWIGNELVLLHDNDESQLSGATKFEDVLRCQELTMQLNIELKSEQVVSVLPQKVSHLIRQYNFENRIMFSSFNPFCLWQISRLLPRVPRALLVSQESILQWYMAPFLPIHMLNLQDSMITQDMANELNQKKIPFSVWTVNNEDRAQELLKWGAQSIITDLIVVDPLRSE